MKKTFILGARDPEMRRIESLLSQAGQDYFVATHRGRRVKSHQAYMADGVMNSAGRRVWAAGLDRISKTTEIVFVECEVENLTPALVCDHHRPGDPGFDFAPKDFLLGSSIGQVLKLLNLEPSPEDLMAAAADHCPAAAYRGECPGVDPLKLAHFRMMEKSLGCGVELSVVKEEVDQATSYIENAPRVEIEGELVADLTQQVPEGPMPALAEASARLGVPVLYRINRKFGINNARERTVRWWMEHCGLDGVYGNPLRGYAGGFTASHLS